MDARRRCFEALVIVALSLMTLGIVEIGSQILEERLVAREGQFPTLSKKAPGEFRVLIYGESTVFGEPIPELGFVSQFEYWVKELYPNRNFKILNYGIRGANSDRIKSALAQSVHNRPDMVIVMLGHNEFLKDTPSHPWLFSQARKLASVRLLTSYLESFTRKQSNRKMNLEVRPFARGDDRFKAKVEHFQSNLEAMIAEVKKVGVPLLLVTSPSNLLDWPPVYRKLPATFRGRDYEPSIFKIQKAIAAGVLEKAQAGVDDLAKRYPDDAMASYLLGKIHFLSGDFSKARKLLFHAKDFDPMPWRAVSEINDIIRQQAFKHDAELVDIVTTFESKAKEGLPGFDLIADNCHPTPLGSSLIATELIQRSIRLRLIPPSRTVTSLNRFMEHLGKQADGYLTQAWLESGLYSMKTPFFNYSASRMYYERVLRTKPSEWIAWANLGAGFLLEGDWKEGVTALKKAKYFKKAALNLDDPKMPYLRQAMESAGLDSNTLDVVHD